VYAVAGRIQANRNKADQNNQELYHHRKSQMFTHPPTLALADEPTPFAIPARLCRCPPRLLSPVLFAQITSRRHISWLRGRRWPHTLARRTWSVWIDRFHSPSVAAAAAAAAAAIWAAYLCLAVSLPPGPPPVTVSAASTTPDIASWCTKPSGTGPCRTTGGARTHGGEASTTAAAVRRFCANIPCPPHAAHGPRCLPLPTTPRPSQSQHGWHSAWDRSL
jgi:hypothetical protein